jgi:hypothetical protein
MSRSVPASPLRRRRRFHGERQAEPVESLHERGPARSGCAGPRQAVQDTGQRPRIIERVVTAPGLDTEAARQVFQAGPRPEDRTGGGQRVVHRVPVEVAAGGRHVPAQDGKVELHAVVRHEHVGPDEATEAGPHVPEARSACHVGVGVAMDLRGRCGDGPVGPDEGMEGVHDHAPRTRAAPISMMPQCSTS